MDGYDSDDWEDEREELVVHVDSETGEEYIINQLGDRVYI